MRRFLAPLRYFRNDKKSVQIDTNIGGMIRRGHRMTKRKVSELKKLNYSMGG